MIYLVEDDNNIRKLVVYTLNANGFEAEGFALPSLFWQAMEEKRPELVLLDIMLPEQDGLAILSQLRLNEATASIPAIMLTAKDTEYDKIVGLDMGADDYIPKPFSMLELVSRVRAVLRRYQRPQTSAHKEYSIGSLYVCPDKHIVQVDGEDVGLSPKEFQLLCTLMESGGSVLSRDALLNRIWGYDFDGESRTVDVHIRNLRHKLGSGGECIETVKGFGYKIGRTAE